MLRPGQVVVLCALALLTLGTVMVNSAVMSVEPVEVTPYGPSAPRADGGFSTVLRSIVFSRWTAYAGLAMVALAAVSMAPVRRWAALLSARSRRALRVP